jgi:hypothetical protein
MRESAVHDYPVRNLSPISAHPIRRHLAHSLALFAATLLLGLATRQYPSVFPALIARYGGDALWAAMVFWLLALVNPTRGTVRIAAYALAISWAVEFSQLYHAPWIDTVRATRAGALVLGQGFLWSDLASYAVGIVLAGVVDVVIVRGRT